MTLSGVLNSNKAKAGNSLHALSHIVAGQSSTLSVQF